MNRTHHEVPTHLNVEDKLLFDLTVRQFLYLLVGASAGYGLWEQTTLLALGIRGALVGSCLVITLAFALLRPGGRPLEEWLLAALVYVASPHRSTWQLVEPNPADWRPSGAAWQELSPSLTWADEQVEP